MAITTKELNSLKPKTKPYIIREPQPNKGHGVLGFKILTSGHVDAYFIYYVNRVEKLKKIGRYGVLSLKEIRSQYAELSIIYRKQGDPKELERQQKIETETKRIAKEAEQKRIDMQGSLGQLIDFYLEDVHANKSNHYYISVKKALNKLDIDKSIKANQITKQNIIQILHPIVERGSMVLANRTRAYLSAMFKYAIEFDDSVESFSKKVQFFVEVNPVTNVKKPLMHEEASDRFLSKSEINELWKAFDKSKASIYRISILKLILLTGARVESLTGLRWSEINWEDKYISIPPDRSKKNNYWIIPLTQMSYEVLVGLPIVHAEFVFPANNGVKCIDLDSMSKCTARICKQSKIAHFSPRDLRRTFKTLTGEIGLLKDIRDRIQNHSLNDISSKHYDRYDYLKEKRDALELWDQFIASIV
jgi:integrase